MNSKISTIPHRLIGDADSRALTVLLLLSVAVIGCNSGEVEHEEEPEALAATESRVAPAAAGDGCAELEHAERVLAQGDALRAAEIAGRCAARALHLVWRSEREIGPQADSKARSEPAGADRPAFDYVSRNRKYFDYYESNARFEPNARRLREIKKLDPESPFLAAMEYQGIARLDEAFWEDGDGTMHTPRLLKEYEAFIEV